MGMAPVRIVTDSTADLSPAIRQELGISVVPLNVHFGDTVYKDQLDITAEAFFVQQAAAAALPRTSQPSPGDFLTVYQQLTADGSDVVSLHISAKLSGTFQSATMAREMLENSGRVHLVDTQSASWGLGWTAVGAARLAAQGKSAADIVAWCSECARRMHVLFGVDTLEYLQKNGRIGKAQAVLGGLIGIKPILGLQDGVVHAFDKVRGKSKVLPRVLELLAEKVPAGRSVRVAIIHGNAEADARIWMDAMAGQYKVAEGIITSIGPVIGCHTGAGVVGVTLYEEF